MKKKRSKLQLNKSTVSNLEMNMLRGGDKWTKDDWLCPIEPPEIPPDKK